MTDNTLDKTCKCACHIPRNVQHGGLAHDSVCCDNLVGTLEWRAVKDREKKMLEFVIPDKKEKQPDSGWQNESMIAGFNEAIKAIRQRAKEWSKKNG